MILIVGDGSLQSAVDRSRAIDHGGQGPQSNNVRGMTRRSIALFFCLLHPIFEIPVHGGSADFALQDSSSTIPGTRLSGPFTDQSSVSNLSLALFLTFGAKS